jgi:tetratricopeptide (TPR) repeat protein
MLTSTISVNYLYGNLEFALGHWPRAKEFYEDALDIALKDTPIHFITSAIYYKLGCVELEMENYDVAKLVF